MTLHAAVIGLGVGEQHIEGFHAHPACEVVAICDKDPKRLAEVAARHPGVRCERDPLAILRDPTVDVVSIASYDDAHYGQIRLALEHGKHVFAEKPLTLHEHEARAIAGVLASHPRLHLSSNVPLRMSPRFEQVRNLVAAGELGEIFHVEGDYDYGRRHKLADGWRGRIDYYSAVLGGAIHMVDLVRWLTGQDVTEVSCAFGSRIATRGTAFRHDDFVLAVLRLRQGGTAKVNANLGCVSPHFHGVRLYGTEGTFINGLPDGHIYRPGGAGADTIVTAVDVPYPGVRKGDLIRPFVTSILGEGEPQVTVHDVFETLATCFAIERALREGGPVPVTSLFH